MRPDLSDCPQPLQDATAEWLENRPEDVVMKAVDGQDVLILSDDANGVVWIDPEGRTRITVASWVFVRGPSE